MDFRQLKALLAIADTGSMTKAAEMLNIVQPAVSRQLKLLEEDVGAVLFERHRLGMQLTPDGEILAAYARRVLQELERARSEIRPGQHALQGKVSVGLLPSTAERLACTLVSRCAQEFPGIRLQFLVGYAGHMQTWLEQGETDLALLYYPHPSALLHLTPVLEEQLWVAAPPDSRLNADQPLPLRALANKPLILPAATHGIRNLVDHLAAASQLSLNIIAETNALDIQKALVRAGHGWTILPPIAFYEEMRLQTLRGAPLSDAGLQRTLGIGQSAVRRTPPAVACVRQLLMESLFQLAGEENWVSSHWIAGPHFPE